MITCDDFDQLVQETRDTALTEEQWSRYLDHEEHCPRHRQLATSAAQGLSDEELVQKSIARLERHWAQRRRTVRVRAVVAFAALLLAVVGMGLWQLRGQKSPENIARPEPVPAPAPAPAPIKRLTPPVEPRELQLGLHATAVAHGDAVMKKRGGGLVILESGLITLQGHDTSYGVYLPALDAGVQALGTRFDVDMLFLDCSDVAAALQRECKDGKLPVALVTMLEHSVDFGRAGIKADRLHFGQSRCKARNATRIYREDCRVRVDAEDRVHRQAFILDGYAPTLVKQEGAEVRPSDPVKAAAADLALMKRLLGGARPSVVFDPPQDAMVNGLQCSAELRELVNLGTTVHCTHYCGQNDPTRFPADVVVDERGQTPIRCPQQ